MKKIFLYLKQLFTAPSKLDHLQRQINSLVQQNGQLRAQISELERVACNHGALLTGAVDVHMRYQPSIAMISWYNSAKCGMDTKCFEIDQEKGLQGVLDFLRSYRIPADKVFFDADARAKHELKYRYRHGE